MLGHDEDILENGITKPTGECCLTRYSRAWEGLKLRDTGDGAKMFNGGQDGPAIEHLRPPSPIKDGDP